MIYIYNICTYPYSCYSVDFRSSHPNWWPQENKLTSKQEVCLNRPMRRYGCFSKLRVLSVGLLMIKALSCGVYNRAPDFWKLPHNTGLCSHGCMLDKHAAKPFGIPAAVLGEPRLWLASAQDTVEEPADR